MLYCERRCTLPCRWGRMDVCVTLLAAGATLDHVDDKVPHTHNTRHTPHDTRDS